MKLENIKVCSSAHDFLLYSKFTAKRDEVIYQESLIKPISVFCKKKGDSYGPY